MEMKLEKVLEMIEIEKENYGKLNKLIEYFKNNDIVAKKIENELGLNSSICDILSTSSDMAYRCSQLLQEKLTEINISI